MIKFKIQNYWCPIDGWHIRIWFYKYYWAFKYNK